jgi:hypothetical protein
LASKTGLLGKKIILGDNNGVIGSNNWVFTQGFSRAPELDNWEIEIDKA